MPTNDFLINRFRFLRINPQTDAAAMAGLVRRGAVFSSLNFVCVCVCVCVCLTATTGDIANAQHA